MKVLIFSGTPEGKRLAQTLLSIGDFQVTVSVATEYGAHSMEGVPGCTLLEGRLSCSEMEHLLTENGYNVVVDATHPYAREVTENLRLACTHAAVPYLRLIRESPPPDSNSLLVPGTEEAVQALCRMPGNILLTTGAKELARFCAIPGYRERIYPRVLPMESSLRACLALGYERSHIIAMQGPFCEELNLALIRQFSIRCLVTKESGREGGYEEKLSAARKAEIPVIVIARPKEVGNSFAEIVRILTEKRGTS